MNNRKLYQNYVEEYYKKFHSSEIIFMSKFKNCTEKMIVKDKYNLCYSYPHHLFKGSMPSIRSAVNKTEYWINMTKEVHGDLYDYSLVEYINMITPVKIIYKENYIFEITPHTHLAGYGHTFKNYEFTNISLRGWEDSFWENVGNCSNNFDSFKVYIIKCWNGDRSEEFYKIGKTFTTIKERFRRKRSMPYNYEILKVIIGNAKYIYLT